MLLFVFVGNYKGLFLVSEKSRICILNSVETVKDYVNIGSYTKLILHYDMATSLSVPESSKIRRCGLLGGDVLLRMDFEISIAHTRSSHLSLSLFLSLSLVLSHSQFHLCNHLFLSLISLFSGLWIRI